MKQVHHCTRGRSRTEKTLRMINKHQFQTFLMTGSTSARPTGTCAIRYPCPISREDGSRCSPSPTTAKGWGHTSADRRRCSRKKGRASPRRGEEGRGHRLLAVASVPVRHGSREWSACEYEQPVSFFITPTHPQNFIISGLTFVAYKIQQAQHNLLVYANLDVDQQKSIHISRSLIYTHKMDF
jgi:hypothetical protein